MAVLFVLTKFLSVLNCFVTQMLWRIARPPGRCRDGGRQRGGHRVLPSGVIQCCSADLSTANQKSGWSVPDPHSQAAALILHSLSMERVIGGSLPASCD